MHSIPHHPLKKSVLALLDSKKELNAIQPIFTKKLNFLIRLTDIAVQKIENKILNTYEIVVAAFLVTKKAN